MKKGKRLGQFLLAFCAAFCMFAAAGGKVSAAVIVPAQPGVAIEGSLEETDSIYCYPFTVDKDGYFTITFGKKDMAVEAKDGWQISLHTANAGGDDYFYKATVTGSLTTPKFPFKAGTQLYLQVKKGGYMRDRQPVGVPYTALIETVAGSYWEREDNDTVQNACVIAPNVNYYGNLYYNKDVDIYRYTVASEGTQTVVFEPQNVAGLDLGNGWTIHVYDGDSNDEIYKQTGVKGKFNVPVMDFKKGTVLFIKLEATYTYPNILNFIEYAIRVEETVDPYWEKENKVKSSESWAVYKNSATNMTLNKDYHGTLYRSDDTDLFKITAAKDGYMTLAFDPNELTDNLGLGYKLSLFSSKGKEICAWKDVKQKRSEKVYLAKGTYYINICANSTYGPYVPTNKMYTVQAGYKQNAPGKVASVKAKKAKISWKKQSGVDGYEISYSLKKNFSGAKKKTTTKTSLSLSGLKKGKTYYVRVRAYRKAVTGAKVYGAWSKTVTAKK